jgi:hypothetical protein
MKGPLGGSKQKSKFPLDGRGVSLLARTKSFCSKHTEKIDKKVSTPFDSLLLLRECDIQGGSICVFFVKFVQSKLDLLNFATVIPIPNFFFSYYQTQRFDMMYTNILSFQFEAFLPDFLVSINSKYICRDRHITSNGPENLV